MTYIKDISSHTSDRNDTYTSYKISIKGFGMETWVVTICDVSTGSYIMVRKSSNNPFGGPGKQYENLNEAILHYNNESMKSALREINQFHSNQSVTNS